MIMFEGMFEAAVTPPPLPSRTTSLDFRRFGSPAWAVSSGLLRYNRRLFATSD